MKRNTLMWVALGMAALGMMVISPASSQAGDFHRKLGRGVNNVMFGIVELPRTVSNVTQHQGGSAGATWGVFKGLTRFVSREIVGVGEIITAPMHTKVKMQPEFLLSNDSLDYDPSPLW